MKWNKNEVGAEEARLISDRFGIDRLDATILARRGVTEPAELLFFLEDDPRYLHNPFLFKGMEDAVDRILAAADEKERVMVFGDRDVDGVSSTALLSGKLAAMGIEVRTRIPKGDEPYGLTIAAIEEFADDYGTLIITVDCGISNVLEAERASERGVDLIVCDHHTPGPELPRVLAVINPKCPDSGYPFRDLAGVGVAHKLAEALDFAATDLYKQQICLLNARPANDSFVLDAIKLSNMAQTARISETLVPGMVDLERTRLYGFLKDQQILVWDEAAQRKALSRVFGGAVDVHLYDLAPEIGKAIPQVAGQSLVQAREKSRLARYRDEPTLEIDVLANLFISFVRKREGVLGGGGSDDLQLVALGTIADMMPLKNENRILVKRGLEAMAMRPRRGIAELLLKLNLRSRRLGSQDIGWQLSPAVNAAGRMGRPERALELLTEEDASRRDALAEEMLAMNKERKQLGADSWAALRPLADESFERHSRKLVMVASADLNRGITGIIAARLAAAFEVPAIAVAILGDGTCVGSMRSRRGFELRPFLDSLADSFIDYGGHDNAAGFSLREEGFAAFAAQVELRSRAIELGEEEDGEALQVDAELPPDFMKPELADMVLRFEPAGEGFPPLVLASKGARIAALELMGKTAQQHVRLTLDFGKHRWPAVYWQAADKVGREFALGDTVDAAFNVGRNSFNGADTPQLVVLDLRRSGV